MTPSLSKFEIRLNLIELVNESLNDSPNQDVDVVRELLRIYRIDTVRKMIGSPGSLRYISTNLKAGIELASSLMRTLKDEEQTALIGWRLGCAPKNLAQAFYSLLRETAAELFLSIAEIMSRYTRNEGDLIEDMCRE